MRKLPRSKAVAIVLWCIVGIVLALGSIGFGAMVWQPGATPGEQVLGGVGLPALLILPSWAAYVQVRRRLRTGTWKASDGERAAWRARAIAHPVQPWVWSVVTGLLSLSALTNMFFLRRQFMRHRGGAFDGILLAVWVVVLLLQVPSWRNRRIARLSRP